MNDDDRLKLSASTEELVVFVVQIVCLGLLGYWSLILIKPFLAIIVWSIIITVALYPIFDWLSAKLYGHRVSGGSRNYGFRLFYNSGSSDVASAELGRKPFGCSLVALVKVVRQFLLPPKR